MPNPDHKHTLSRRRFLATIPPAAVAAAATAAANTQITHAPAQTPPPPTNQTAKNLIFLVSDGMSAGTLNLADLFIRATQGRPSHWMQMINRPQTRRALLDTQSANSLVTDSAAAATTWGIGEPVNNGAMGYTPDNRAPLPILPRAKQHNRYTAVATTTRVTHATPAGWCCNIPAGRNAEDDIAQQMVERDIDLILGGGKKHFPDLNAATQRGYRVITTRQQLKQLTNESRHTPKLLGLFADSHLAYDIDRKNVPELNNTQPSIAELTEHALRIAKESVRQANQEGFIIQIEGGRVDHAAHANDAVALIHDQAALDDALAIAISFIDENPDTLLVACTDHANANPGLTDYLDRGNHGFQKLIEGGRHSFEWLFEQLNDDTPLETLVNLIEHATGITLEREELITLQRWRNGAQPHPFKLGNKNAGVLAALLANHTKVAFLSPNHTADAVEVAAIGPGAHHFTGTMNMPDIHHAIVNAIQLPPAR